MIQFVRGAEPFQCHDFTVSHCWRLLKEALVSPAQILSQQIGLPQAVLAAQAPGLITGLTSVLRELYLLHIHTQLISE